MRDWLRGWRPLRLWGLAAMGVVSLAGGSACAPRRAPGTKPDDMSHSGHLRAAAELRASARAHAARYDPRAAREVVVGAASLLVVPEEVNTVTVNPTAEHLDHGRVRREAARQHEAAARALERFEARYCGTLPAAARRAHPLLGKVARVEPFHGGVCLVLRQPAGQALVARMACHVAHARLKGYAGNADCPLHLRGVGFRLVEGGRVVLLVARSGAQLDELERRARVHFGR